MIEELSLLTGLWKGSGTARFPTIETTDYFEELEFSFVGDDESIMFEQRTWFSINGQQGKPLHWESGFIIAFPDGSFELYNAQNSKRVEVMKSSIVKQNESTLHILFDSKYFGNDDRMVRTSREFTIKKKSLVYEMKMATRSTSEFQGHLKAVLERV